LPETDYQDQLWIYTEDSGGEEMVKIRLKRIGAKKAPFYRLVVADSRYPRDGRFLEEIGYYNPNTNPSEVKVDVEKAKDWLRKGAQPTDTVRALLKKSGVL
jgi:small subunit ribosomal protein S16